MRQSSPRDPETLALAVTRVEEIIFVRVQLWNTYDAIFRAIIHSKRKLKTLVIQSYYEVVDWVQDVNSMAHAVCMVQNVVLDFSELTTVQLEVLFTNISTSSELNLQNLTINLDHTCSGVSEVSPEVLASAVCRLKKCNMCSSGMTTEQLEVLCSEIVYCKNLPLSYLNIGNMLELEDVDEDILASAVVRLEVVEMVYKSTDAQLHAILNKVVEYPDSKLKELHVLYVDEEEPETRSLLMKVKEDMIIYNYKKGNWCSSDYSPKQVIV